MTIRKQRGSSQKQGGSAQSPLALSALFILAFGLLLPSCGNDDGATLVVSLLTDYVPTVEFAEVRISLTTPAGDLVQVHAVTTAADYVIGSRVATFEGVTPGAYRMRADLILADGRILGSREKEGTIGGVTAATFVISRSCRNNMCPTSADASATECSGGRCVPPECSPENVEACVGGCTQASDCVSEVSCATGVCTTEGACLFMPLGLCEADEYCELSLGCQARPIPSDAGTDGGVVDDGGVDGSIVDAGFDVGIDAEPDAGLPSCDMPCDTGNPCEAGTFDCTSGVPVCEVSGPAAAGIVCGEAAGPCDAEEVCDGASTSCPADAKESAGTTCNAAAGECDIQEVCDGSSNACPIDAFQPVGTGCPGGFCDATHSCSDSCTPGVACTPANVCRRGRIECSGAEPTCVEDGNVGDGTECMSTEYGGWGACGGFSSTCDETGNQTQDVTTHTCQAGTCAASATSDSRPCSRGTEGGSCGGVMTGGWGSCSGYVSTCDESGTRMRTITTPLCESASCVNTMTTETGGCSRDTDGVSCGSVTTGAWGSCGGYTSTCDEGGSRSRSIMTPTCGTGSCGTVTTSENGGCSRDTDGTSCGTITYGTWGACGGFTSTCDTTGTRSRSVMTPVCGGGGCSTVTTSENGVCSRSTNGTSCGTTTYGAWGACSYSDCSTSGTRSRSRTIYECAASSCDGVVDSVSESCSRTVSAATTCSTGHCCGGAGSSCTDTRTDTHCSSCFVACTGGLSCGPHLAGWQCMGCTNNFQCQNILDSRATCGTAGSVSGCACHCASGTVCADGGCGAGFYCHDQGPVAHCESYP